MIEEITNATDDCRGCHDDLCHGCEPRLAAVVPRNPKPGDEVVIFELGEPEPPGWIAKWNERSGRIAAGVRIEG